MSRQIPGHRKNDVSVFLRHLFREWYNGYLFGNTDVYNPWSVIRYVKALAVHEDEFPHSYWANTFSNTVVRRLIDMADDRKCKIPKIFIVCGH